MLDIAQNTLDIRRMLRWLQDENYILTREDKTKKIVLMTKDCYDEFLFKHIESTGALEINQDPTEKLANKVERLVKDKRFPQIWTVRKQNAPACPRLFALVKTHKTPIDIRPIVEKRLAPTYYLEKAIAAWCNNILGNINSSTMVMATVLSRLRALKVNDSDIFTTYDFEALYPSLRIEPVCIHFYRFLLEHVPQFLREIAHTICYNSYFTFRGKIYRQVRGMPIGSLIAGTLAEILLRVVESQKFPKFQPFIKFYIRYVDDLLVVWKDENKIDELTKDFSLEQFGIKLIKDQVSISQLHYLDLSLLVDAGNINTSVYRKSPTNPFSSQTGPKIRLAIRKHLSGASTKEL